MNFKRFNHITMFYDSGIKLERNSKTSVKFLNIEN